jgi:hypothetical protein
MAIFCDNKETIHIAYFHTIGNWSKHINIVYYLGYQSIKSGQTTLFQVMSAKYLAHISTKQLYQINLWKFRDAINDAKWGGMLDGIVYFTILWYHYGYSFYNT